MTFKEKYEAYLLTDKWKAIKEYIHKRDRNRCRRCKSKENLQVHHLTYKRVFEEDMGDLLLVCAYCHHRYFHNNIPLWERAVMFLHKAGVILTILALILLTLLVICDKLTLIKACLGN